MEQSSIGEDHTLSRHDSLLQYIEDAYVVVVELIVWMDLLLLNMHLFGLDFTHSELFAYCGTVDFGERKCLFKFANTMTDR